LGVSERLDVHSSREVVSAMALNVKRWWKRFAIDYWVTGPQKEMQMRILELFYCMASK
jgi:hypothetical protein